MVKVWLTIGIMLFGVSAFGQTAHAFATAHANKSKVLVEQPVKITIVAYSSTWFASGLSMENMRVDGAFVQSFKQTLSTMKIIDGKKYAALEFYYVLFPYVEGDLVFPALSINASVPPPGEYKGEELTLTTEPLHIRVEGIPSTADKDNWLVANNASISNIWSKDLSQLKTGDVLVRTITTKAYGTLPSFIDEPKVESVDFGEIYAGEAKFYDERDAKNVNGKRIDTYSYLLEKEGDYEVPEIRLTWYNPYTEQNYAKVLPGYKLSIAPNPDMESMQNLKDSLMALNPNVELEEAAEDEKPSLSQWIERAILLLVVLAILSMLVKLIKGLVVRAKKKKENYLNSESYWFKQVIKQKEPTSLLRSLYAWLDHSNLGIASKTLNGLSEDDEVLNEEYKNLKEGEFKKGKGKGVNTNQVIKDTQGKRKELKHKKEVKIGEYDLESLNP